MNRLGQIKGCATCGSFGGGWFRV